MIGQSDSADRILDVVWWLPNRVLRYMFQPVTDMLESLADNSEAAVKEYAEKHGL